MRLALDIDVRRTELQRRFFERYAGVTTSDGLVAAVAAEKADVAALIGSEDCVTLAGAGWTYWWLYLKGYIEYRERGVVDPDNVYARYFVDHYLPGPYDPGLRGQFPDTPSALARVAARFADLHRLLGPRRRASAPREYVPIRILGSSRRSDDMHDVYDASSGIMIKARAIDGWHRLFAARLTDVRTLPGVVRLDESTWTSTP